MFCLGFVLRGRRREKKSFHNGRSILKGFVQSLSIYIFFKKKKNCFFFKVAQNRISTTFGEKFFFDTKFF